MKPIRTGKLYIVIYRQVQVIQTCVYVCKYVTYICIHSYDTYVICKCVIYKLYTDAYKFCDNTL